MAASLCVLLRPLACAVGLFASVALHELGHSVVSLRKQCRVREILLLPIGGIAKLERMPERPRDEFHIAIAGPIVSFALALLAYWISVGFSLLGWGLAGLLFSCLPR